MQAEIVFLLAAAKDAGSRVECDRADWRTCRCGPARCSSSAIPSSRSTASAAPTSTSTTSCAARFSDPGVGRGAAADDELPVGAEPVRLGERRLRTAVSRRSRPRTRRASRALDPHQPTAAQADVRHRDRHGSRCDEGGRRRRRGADAIARYIRAEVDAGRRTLQRLPDPDAQEERAHRPYAAALEALNIPIEVSGAGAFGESPEVAALHVLLRALADPQDPLSLIARAARPAVRHQRSASCSPSSRPAAGSASSPERPQHPEADRGACVRRRARRCASVYRWTRVLPAGAALDRILEAHRLPRAGRDHARRRRRRRPVCTPSTACARWSRTAAAWPMPPTRSKRPRGDERGRIAAARARPQRRRPADEPAQGQGARGRRRVPGRSRAAASRRAWTSTSSATGAAAQGWFMA